MLLCPGPDSSGLLFTLVVLATVPVAGAVVGTAIGEVVKALKRRRLR